MKKALFLALALCLLLTAGGAGLYAWNRAPAVPPVSAVPDGRPYVIKLHAQWCPKCLMTKGAWSQLQDAYMNRVNFLVFDFTDQGTTDASGVEARRVGLGEFFETAGGTGSVIVLDGRTREVRAWISGVHGFAEYAAAIDETLRKAS